MNSDELRALLEIRTRQHADALEENWKLKLAMGERIGGGIDPEKYHHQLVCKRCLAIVGIPDNHICVGEGS